MRVWHRSEAARVGHASKATVGWMIARHYLGKWPAVPRCILGMWCHEVAVGTVVFASAPRETSVRYGGETWELARLWIVDELPRNTESWLIAQSVRHVAAAHPDVRVLVSYADPSRGHSGTIYRASNWTPDGMTDEGRKTPRSDYAAALPSGLLDGPASAGRVGRRSHIRGEAVRSPRQPKHRFVMRLRSPRQPRTLWGRSA